MNPLFNLASLFFSTDERQQIEIFKVDFKQDRLLYKSGDEFGEVFLSSVEPFKETLSLLLTSLSNELAQTSESIVLVNITENKFEVVTEQALSYHLGEKSWENNVDSLCEPDSITGESMGMFTFDVSLDNDTNSYEYETLFVEGISEETIQELPYDTEFYYTQVNFNEFPHKNSFEEQARDNTLLSTLIFKDLVELPPLWTRKNIGYQLTFNPSKQKVSFQQQSSIMLHEPLERSPKN
jgi:hypothetical protein